MQTTREQKRQAAISGGEAGGKAWVNKALNALIHGRLPATTLENEVNRAGTLPYKCRTHAKGDYDIALGYARKAVQTALEDYERDGVVPPEHKLDRPGASSQPVEKRAALVAAVKALIERCGELAPYRVDPDDSSVPDHSYTRWLEDVERQAERAKQAYIREAKAVMMDQLAERVTWYRSPVNSYVGPVKVEDVD